MHSSFRKLQQPSQEVGGYTFHSLAATAEGVRGCLTLVRNAIPHRRVRHPVHCGDGVEVS